MKVYDPQIRSLLINSFLQVYEFANEDTVVVNELDICSGASRADVVVINGSLHGYEIKSGQDTLERLPLQIESYNQVFNTMTIVAFNTHIDRIKEIVPKWWGIKCVSEKKGNIEIRDIRKGKNNNNISLQSVALLLWREEMIELLSLYSNSIKGLSSKSRRQLSEIIVERVNGNAIEEYVREALKSRKTWKAVQLQQLNDDLHCIQPIL